MDDYIAQVRSQREARTSAQREAAETFVVDGVEHEAELDGGAVFIYARGRMSPIYQYPATKLDIIAAAAAVKAYRAGREDGIAEGERRKAAEMRAVLMIED